VFVFAIIDTVPFDARCGSQLLVQNVSLSKTNTAIWISLAVFSVILCVLSIFISFDCCSENFELPLKTFWLVFVCISVCLWGILLANLVLVGRPIFDIISLVLFPITVAAVFLGAVALNRTFYRAAPADETGNPGGQVQSTVDMDYSPLVFFAVIVIFIAIIGIGFITPPSIGYTSDSMILDVGTHIMDANQLSSPIPCLPYAICSSLPLPGGIVLGASGEIIGTLDAPINFTRVSFSVKCRFESISLGNVAFGMDAESLFKETLNVKDKRSQKEGVDRMYKYLYYSLVVICNGALVGLFYFVRRFHQPKEESGSLFERDADI